jgi:glutathione S-transferase
MSVMKLGYWNIRGLAQASRFLLEYTGVAYTDVLYVQAGPTAPVPFDKSAWFDVKNTLGFDFPNLPYLIDGDLKITQSQAVMRHIARKCPEMHMFGKDDAEMCLVDMLLGEYTDKKSKMTILQYTDGTTGAGEVFIKGGGADDMRAHLGRFEAFLGDKEWFVGGRVTAADCCLYEYCTQCFCYAERAEAGDYRVEFPLLDAFCRRFEALPRVKEYMGSERFALVTSGFNNQHAKFR